jgi:hypothetical protein
MVNNVPDDCDEEPQLSNHINISGLSNALGSSSGSSHPQTLKNSASQRSLTSQHTQLSLNQSGPIHIQDLSNQNQNVKTNNGSHQHSEDHQNLKNSNGSHRHIPSDDQINQSKDTKNSQIHKIGEQNVDMGYHRSQTNLNIQNSNTASQNNLRNSMGSLTHHSLNGDQPNIDLGYHKVRSQKDASQNILKNSIGSEKKHSDSNDHQSNYYSPINVRAPKNPSQNILKNSIGSPKKHSDSNDNQSNYYSPINVRAPKNPSQNILKNSNGSPKKHSDSNDHQSNYYSNRPQLRSRDINHESPHIFLSKSTNNETTGTNRTIINSRSLSSLKPVNKQNFQHSRSNTAHSTSVNTKTDHSPQMVESYISNEYSEITDQIPVINDSLCSYFDTETMSELDPSTVPHSSYFSNTNIEVLLIN